MHTLRETLKVVGVSESEFQVRTNATLELGIRFAGWLDDPDERPGAGYFHPFELPTLGDGFNFSHHWHALRAREAELRDYAVDVGVAAVLAAGRVGPKLAGAGPYEAPVPYAYHLDAILFGRYLRDVSTARGVRHVVGTVGDVVLGEGGDIDELVMTDGTRLGAELYLDCTGFAARLLEEALGADFHPYGERLLCDRAPWRCAPPTTPGRSRIATTPRRRLPRPAGSGTSTSTIGAESATSTRVGRRKTFWLRNRLAVGGSGGFIEPVESTGVYLIETGPRVFLDHLPVRRPAPAVVRSYNRVLRGLYDELCDIVRLHYVLTRRRDTQFWRWNATMPGISEELRERLDVWSHKLPNVVDFDNRALLFGPENYASIMSGMERFPDVADGTLGALPAERSMRVIDLMRELQGRAVRTSMPHTDFLRKQHGAFA